MRADLTVPVGEELSLARHQGSHLERDQGRRHKETVRVEEGQSRLEYSHVWAFPSTAAVLQQACRPLHRNRSQRERMGVLRWREQEQRPPSS